MREPIQQGQLARPRRSSASGLFAAIAAVFLLGVTTAALAAPPAPLAASEVTGCCACRGTAGGAVDTLKSCSDGTKVDACVSQCKEQNAGSIVFGKNQTCSQGCAGFPTQSLH